MKKSRISSSSEDSDEYVEFNLKENLDNLIKKEWEKFVKKNKEVKIPDAFLCIHQKKIYITMNDESSIFYFYSSRGKIFVAAKRFCKLVKNNGVNYYEIENFEELQVISCRNILDNLREPFIAKKIRRYLINEI